MIWRAVDNRGRLVTVPMSQMSRLMENGLVRTMDPGAVIYLGDVYVYGLTTEEQLENALKSNDLQLIKALQKEHFDKDSLEEALAEMKRFVESE